MSAALEGVWPTSCEDGMEDGEVLRYPSNEAREALHFQFQICLCPGWMSWVRSQYTTLLYAVLPEAVTSYSLDSCFPDQVQLVLLNAVSWTFSTHFEVKKGPDFPVILTHHWHPCMSLLQSRTNTKTASRCTLRTKSLQVESENVGRKTWESWVVACALPGLQIKELDCQGC